ncbi:hypothetical protein L6164_018460 [Bauhinia variegata]|uniref:Uncharacterized protein n=1 Tax=Bauhinia variegata TaxID=167791 RepID=A0ACB9ND11_BAUVA|nr:hypothetical protein L6164_018460 [Bauhinia variegata]
MAADARSGESAIISSPIQGNLHDSAVCFRNIIFFLHLLVSTFFVDFWFSSVKATLHMEQNLSEHACWDSNGGASHKKNLKSISAQTRVRDSDTDNDCFDCNICLDSPHDPMVTLCGHLYCWPCIYKWLQVQSSSDESEQQQKCPVCKANISLTSLVPLYGRENSVSEARRTQMGLGIPRRPLPHSLNSLLTSAGASTSHLGQQLHPNYFQPQPYPFQYQQYFPHLYGGYTANGSPYHGGAPMTAFFSPMIGMFGEMVFARMFGISDANLFSYRYINSYPHNGGGTARMRRQEMQTV